MATPLVGDLMTRLLRPNPKRLIRLMGSMGERETIVRHPQLIEALVAAAAEPTAAAANHAELRAVISPIGFRRGARVQADELRRLTTPTLLIWGDHDPVGTVDAARSVAGLIPDARLEVLPGGHVPYLGNPERVSDLLSEFVRVGGDR
jgi:surfactin synthase thioesterase subunit